MIEHDIEEYLNDIGVSEPVENLKFYKLLKFAKSEIEILRKSDKTLSQIEGLTYLESWIKLAEKLTEPHKYSIEKLYHFTCGACQKWWSIADFQKVNCFESVNKVICPHCGYMQTIKKIKDDDPA